MGRRRTFGTVRKLPSGRYQARYLDPSGYRHRAPLTFATIADANRWLESRPGLRPRTVELYRSLLDHHLLPTLGDRQLGKLTAPVVRHWYASLLRSSAPRAVTVAKAYRFLRAILNTAVADELIVRNPCTIKGGGVERTPERPVATVAQVWALAGAAEPRFRALVLTAAFAGLRFGELAAPTRARVDLEARTISVVENQVELSGGVLLIGPPKSEAGRRRS